MEFEGVLIPGFNEQLLVLCKYSKFWIKQLLQYPIRNEHNYSKYTREFKRMMS